MKARLGADTVKMKYLSPSTVSGKGATVTEMTDNGKAVAGVNNDYFDINNSWAAGGWGISDGKVLKSGNPGSDIALAQTGDGLAKLVTMALKGSVAFNSGSPIAISRVNTFWSDSNDVTLFNSQWGGYRRNAVLGSDAGIEVIVGADNIVTSVGEPGSGQLPDGAQALVARVNSANGALLAAVKVGDTAKVTYDFDRSMGDITEAGGIWQNLIRDGQPSQYGDDPYFTGRNPRTILGLSRDGKTVYFVVADGRAGNALGMTFADEIALMQDLGAYEAVNVDGGGSSQMNTRRPGDETSSVENQPSDGVERYDGDGMGFVLARPGSGVAAGVAIAPVSQDAHADRVFPGLNRTFAAKPYDESKSPVKTAVKWYTADARVQVASGANNTARVQGVKRGSTRITASSAATSGERRVQVLGELARVEASENSISLTSNAPSDLLALTGVDANGFSAPIEVQDAKISNNDDQLVKLEPQPDGRLKLSAVGAKGSETLTVSVAGKQIKVAVTVGVEDHDIVNIGERFDLDKWYASGSRAEMTLEKAIGRDGTTYSAEKLNYDFTKSSANRTANTWPSGPGYPVPGQPKTIKIWSKATTDTGDNSKTYIAFSDKNGAFKYIYGEAPTNDWTQLTYKIPEGTLYPITFEGVATYETSSGNQAKGSIWFDNPTAEVAPEVDLPDAPKLQDHEVIRASGSTDDASQRIAVMSDAQFVARNPDSYQVQGTRQALREIVASKPDAMIINGDLVDEASTADFALAKQILQEELKDVTFPWYYVPGNHEIMGANIDNFVNAKLGALQGAPNGHFDLEGTRFITLNTSTGKLSSDFSQLKMLRQQLDDAKSNPAITGVVLVQHMPIDDQNVVKVSQLADRLDAQMEQDWINEFRAESGKSIAMVNGHVGDFYAKRIDGVPYVVNGNSGKNPADGEQGGFVGWTMLGIDPASGDWKRAGKDLADDNAKWFVAETKVRATGLALDEIPATLSAGEQLVVTGEVAQDEGRSAALAWPMSAKVEGSEKVFVGRLSAAPVDAIAAIDPDTLKLTALHAGSGSVRIDVSGQAKDLAFSVTGGDAKVSGDAKVGATLRAQAGEWAAGAQLAYQWLRDGEKIDDATAASYELQGDDLGAEISVRVTARIEGRADVTTEAKLADRVAAGVQAEGTVRITGTARFGATLTASGSGWAKDAKLSYQWLRDGEKISGATEVGYRATAADVAKGLTVRVVATRAGYHTVTVDSASVKIDKNQVARTQSSAYRVSVRALSGGRVSIRVSAPKVLSTQLPQKVRVTVAGAKRPVTVTLHNGTATVKASELKSTSKAGSRLKLRVRVPAVTVTQRTESATTRTAITVKVAAAVKAKTVKVRR